MHKMHAFVNIFVESSLMDDVVNKLLAIDNVEELYEVTGEFDLVALVSTEGIEEFRDTLNKKILNIHGIRSTVSSIVLQANKGPKCTMKDF